MKPTKVLVAIDGSECSARALAAGAEQARLSGAALAIVYAVDPLPALSPEFIPTAGIFEELRLAGEELLKKTAAGLSPAPQTFLRQGRLQLMDGWDALAEHVRLLELPARASVMVDLQQGPGVLHRREKDGRARVLFDARVAIAPPAAGHALGLDDLFAELNA